MKIGQCGKQSLCGATPGWVQTYGLLRFLFDERLLFTCDLNR